MIFWLAGYYFKIEMTFEALLIIFEYHPKHFQDYDFMVEVTFLILGTNFLIELSFIFAQALFIFCTDPLKNQYQTLSIKTKTLIKINPKPNLKKTPTPHS